MEAERVQAIASLSAAANDIPAEFVRPDHEQPGFTTYRGRAPEIPVVDLACDADQGALVSRVVAAASEWGIFQVVNHGIPVEVVRELQRVGKGFFELPQEQKEKYASTPGSTEGYGTKLQKDAEGKKAWVDFLFHNIWPPARINYAFWPNIPQDYRYYGSERGL